MANTVTRRILADGGNKIVASLYIASDGASGESTDAVAVDVSTLAAAPSTVTIERIQASLAGMAGILEFDATADVPFFVLPSDQTVDIDFTSFGGIKDNSGAGSTGDILITTTGMTAAGDAGYIIFHLRTD